uniref:Uncharacterized protein n=1 Tax=Arundo donax TaxID=35708 RepID=A0A0A9ABE9_ARUDO
MDRKRKLLTHFSYDMDAISTMQLIYEFICCLHLKYLGHNVV